MLLDILLCMTMQKSIDMAKHMSVHMSVHMSSPHIFMNVHARVHTIPCAMHVSITCPSCASTDSCHMVGSIPTTPVRPGTAAIYSYGPGTAASCCCHTETKQRCSSVRRGIARPSSSRCCCCAPTTLIIVYTNLFIIAL